MYGRLDALIICAALRSWLGYHGNNQRLFVRTDPDILLSKSSEYFTTNKKIAHCVC